MVRGRDVRRILATAAALAVSPTTAQAQVDPLLFLKRTQPNIIVMIDVGERMQRDAPFDPANPLATSTYYDPFVYTRTSGVNAGWEAALGVTDFNTNPSGRYRRKYINFVHGGGGSDKGTVSTIGVVGDKEAGFASFEAATRLALARAALYQAIQENQGVARFGLYKTRQSAPTIGTQGNLEPIAVSATDLPQQTPTETGSATGRWRMTRATVDGRNGSNLVTWPNPDSQLVAPEGANQNATILDILARDPRTAGGLVPAGLDEAGTIDEPVTYMIDDVKSEAIRLSALDHVPTVCRNAVAILVTGGGEGNTTPGADPIAAARSLLLAVPNRRVPLIVIAIAPPSADVAQLRAIASASGGQYFEIARAQIDAALASPIQANTSGPMAGTVVVPELVDAINVGIQTAFQDFNDINTAPYWLRPWKGWNGYRGSPIIPSSEFQVTSPIVGTVNLDGARDVNDALLPLTSVTDTAGASIPQRNNLMVTSGFTLPGFDGILRAFRVYRPHPDSTQLSGYKFVSDGTPLWIASTPPDPDRRNLYTAKPDGTIVPFRADDPATLATLARLMNLTVSDATAVIDAVRSLPIGAVVDSTPAIMSPPSLDPPPDDGYPAFAARHTHRRSIIWVGTNRGILEGIDARYGVEVWGFIPLNLLPKLRTLRDGQPVQKFDYFVDGSPRIADVRIDGRWRTHLIVGEGPGGTFYQSFDVTMDDQAAALGGTNPDRDATLAQVLTYFSGPSKIALNWAFPRYSSFDPTLSMLQPTGDVKPYGDLEATASPLEKSVGQTWSDPAVGQVQNGGGPYVVLLGSGFFPYSVQQNLNRGSAIAGTTFYIVNAKTGAPYDSRNVGSDGLNETVDDCRSNATGCSQIKNALQSGPVATGPADQRFITRVYIGDLDGTVWRFDIGLDSGGNPKIDSTTKLYPAGSDQPIFNSMATVNVGGTQQYVFFGTGGDLLPATDVNTKHHLLGVLDTGGGGTKTLDRLLNKTNSLSANEKVTAFPAVAGDTVFFTTTTFDDASFCAPPSANLYAFTFIGGPAYDTTGDNTVTITDSPLVKTVAGQRATAPVIADRHLAFVSGAQLLMFGDPGGYNNGVGQAGVRVLSWREVR
jgi:hypothetical protein